MPQKLHLIIPGAVLPQGDAEALSAAAPATPKLRALLAAMDPATRIECEEDSPFDALRDGAGRSQRPARPSPLASFAPILVV